METDYLVIGAGAVAMAFVDTLLRQDTTCEVILVDRRDHAGGHWNDAYPFIRLHQPSAFYGVESRPLGHGDIDNDGPNAGFRELASRDEILDYYDQVLHKQFLASGRVRWLPKHGYEAGPDGEHVLTSLVDGTALAISARRRMVDATASQIQIPATHKPSYSVARGLSHIPVGGLSKIERSFRTYVVIGAGKTGMDACIWLLQHGVDPHNVSWIMPNDPWILNRSFANDAPGMALAALKRLRAIADARKFDDVTDSLERDGVLLRIDPTVKPTAYRCAFLSPGELGILRRIQNVVRLGHVQAIEHAAIRLTGGQIPSNADTLYVDCSARGTHRLPGSAVFQPGRLTLQTLRYCQPVFSAALIGLVESLAWTDDAKNALCRPVPSPKVPLDMLRMLLPTILNAKDWDEVPAVASWIANSRLDRLTALGAIDDHDPQELEVLIERTRIIAPQAVKCIAEMLKTLE